LVGLVHELARRLGVPSRRPADDEVLPTRLHVRSVRLSPSRPAGGARDRAARRPDGG
jgi:hypothetical protein